MARWKQADRRRLRRSRSQVSQSVGRRISGGRQRASERGRSRTRRSGRGRRTDGRRRRTGRRIDTVRQFMVKSETPKPSAVSGGDTQNIQRSNRPSIRFQQERRLGKKINLPVPQKSGNLYLAVPEKSKETGSARERERSMVVGKLR